LKVSRYIHLNPVTAKICENPEDYKWSSYRYYITHESLDWLVKTEILKYFNGDNEYHEFVSEGIDNETVNFYKSEQSKTIIGSEKFVNTMLKNINEKQKIFCSPDVKRFNKLPSVEIIAEIVSQYFSINPNQLQVTTRGKQNIPRMVAIFLSRRYAQLSYKKISDFYKHLTVDSVGLAIKRFEERIKTDVKVSEYINEICKKVEEHDL
jgi:chromosomal replication initiation ATPase DnaA